MSIVQVNTEYKNHSRNNQVESLFQSWNQFEYDQYFEEIK